MGAYRHLGGHLGSQGQDRFERAVEPRYYDAAQCEVERKEQEVDPSSASSSNHRDGSLTPIRARHVSHV